MVKTATSPGFSTTTTATPKRFLRIIYADDMAELRDVARISFSREGHGIECVPDGVAAMARVTADPGFDLLITDHHMPNMNGLELVRQLREHNFAGKIVVFSSELSSDVAAEYKRLKIDRMLYKPVFPSVLRQAINELFPNAIQPRQTVSVAPGMVTKR